jgi:hypothetical protein
VAGDSGGDQGVLRVPAPGEVYPDDDFVFWEFSIGSLRRLGRRAGFGALEIIDMPIIDDHPRILGVFANAA